MIKTITPTDNYMAFAISFYGDRMFSDPMLATEEQMLTNLRDPVWQPDGFCSLGVYQENTLTGLFIFSVGPQERYMEMLVGLSRDPAAYEEVLGYLKDHFSGYHCDFVYNPRNRLIQAALAECGADFDKEQVKLVLQTAEHGAMSASVIPYSATYWEGYLAIHRDQGRYWTAERVASHPDCFRVLLAVAEDEVVGYIDVTHLLKENEPCDLFVREDRRRRGYGRALLARAIEENKPSGMMVLVDFDNHPAIELYLSMGFSVDEQGGNITASLVF